MHGNEKAVNGGREREREREREGESLTFYLAKPRTTRKQLGEEIDFIMKNHLYK